MYLAFFIIALACFAFHTAVHLLEHFSKIKDSKGIHISIGISMFLGWSSYFYISFSGFSPEGFGPAGYVGLALLIAGFYLFAASHSEVHKRMYSGKGKLVTDGLYKHIRHPMYLGEILMLLGAPVLGQNITTLFLSPVFIIQILIWRFLEEKEMVKEFPEYREYKKRTWF